MDSFAFHPELLDERTRVIAELSDAGFEWLSDFGAVDLLHDVYGLEVTGVREEADCRSIASGDGLSCTFTGSSDNLPLR